jgi:creatinine amidohydrolase
MTVTLEPITLIKAIEDICSSLIKNGIRRILIINGHDGNIAPIELSARTLKDKYPDVIIACLEAWWTVIGQVDKNLFDDWNGLGHGGEAETSAMLSVRSDLVDMKNAPEKIIPKLPPNIRIYWRFNELTQTGATGAPRKATRAKGDKILEVLEELLLEFIKDMEKDNWKYGLALGALTDIGLLYMYLGITKWSPLLLRTGANVRSLRTFSDIDLQIGQQKVQSRSHSHFLFP